MLLKGLIKLINPVIYDLQSSLNTGAFWVSMFDLDDWWKILNGNLHEIAANDLRKAIAAMVKNHVAMLSMIPNQLKLPWTVSLSHSEKSRA